MAKSSSGIKNVLNLYSDKSQICLKMALWTPFLDISLDRGLKYSFQVMIYGVDYRENLKCLVFAVSNYHAINIAEGNVTLAYPVDTENNGTLFNIDVESVSF